MMRTMLWTIVLVLLTCVWAFAQTGEATPAGDQPQSAKEFFDLAVERFKAGDLAAAERHARTVIALENRNAEAQYLLGRILLYKAAQKNRLLIENRGAGSSVLPADNAWKEGQTELQEAVTQFQITIRLEPTNASAWLLLATSLDNLGQDEEALNAYKQTINIDPSAPTARDAYNNIGLLYKAQKKYKEAKEAYEAALRIDPTFQPARINLEKLKELKPGLFR